jgi:hypothetical protein
LFVLLWAIRRPRGAVILNRERIRSLLRLAQIQHFDRSAKCGARGSLLDPASGAAPGQR